MFDIGWGELLLIAVVALIAIGPKELPGALRTLGQWTGKIRRMAGEFQQQFQDAMREAELADIKSEVDKMAAEAAAVQTNFDPIAEMRHEVETAQRDIEAAVAAPSSTTTSPTTASPTTASAASPPPAAPPPVDAVSPATPAAEPAPGALPLAATLPAQPTPAGEGEQADKRPASSSRGDAA
jgi:sec-independent protein translocase protein TatB